MTFVRNRVTRENLGTLLSQHVSAGKFVNIWSVEGEEGTTTAEMGWGTHKKSCLARMGMNTFVASWVPLDHNIVGMVVRHGEAFRITEKLTVWDGGKALPAYGPLCVLSVRLRNRLAPRAARLRLQARTAHPRHDDEIINGADLQPAPIRHVRPDPWQFKNFLITEGD